MKPLFRWTVGPCLSQGIDILIESVRMANKIYGDIFDWMICYNNISDQNLKTLQSAVKVDLVKQNWRDCPIDDEEQSPQREDGSFEWNGNRCGGTLWKACPARMRIESHEIVMDNDIILNKNLPEIDEFLHNDKVLILEEPIRFYGRYDHLLPEKPFYNSGLMGLPPNFDFGSKIKFVWEQTGLKRISQSDEQGLLMAVLSNESKIIINKEIIVEILARDFVKKPNGHEGGIHFTQSNRMPNHRAWNHYRQILQDNLLI